MTGESQSRLPGLQPQGSWRRNAAPPNGVACRTLRGETDPKTFRDAVCDFAIASGVPLPNRRADAKHLNDNEPQRFEIYSFRQGKSLTPVHVGRAKLQLLATVSQRPVGSFVLAEPLRWENLSKPERAAMRHLFAAAGDFGAGMSCEKFPQWMESTSSGAVAVTGCFDLQAQRHAFIDKVLEACLFEHGVEPLSIASLDQRGRELAAETTDATTPVSHPLSDGVAAGDRPSYDYDTRYASRVDLDRYNLFLLADLEDIAAWAKADHIESVLPQLMDACEQKDGPRIFAIEELLHALVAHPTLLAKYVDFFDRLKVDLHYQAMLQLWPNPPEPVWLVINRYEKEASPYWREFCRWLRTPRTERRRDQMRAVQDKHDAIGHAFANACRKLPLTEPVC